MLQVVNIQNSNVEFVNKEADPIVKLEQANAELLYDSMMKDMRIEELEKQQAGITFELIANGVL